MEIIDILMNKLVSFLYVSVIQKKFARASPRNFFAPPPNPKTVPTALQEQNATSDNQAPF